MTRLRKEARQALNTRMRQQVVEDHPDHDVTFPDRWDWPVEMPRLRACVRAEVAAIMAEPR